ncbi:MAG: DUF3987 domain-containing protein [Deltaproteobacteria bacterium]|nr:DUF3987 domain-containing protein [Deltaproteobacteria bacterium]
MAPIAQTTTEEITRKLENVKPCGDGWMASCPAHKDRNPSFSLRTVDGKSLFKCHAGCTQEAVISALRSLGAWPETQKEKYDPKLHICKKILAQSDPLDTPKSDVGRAYLKNRGLNLAKYPSSVRFHPKLDFFKKGVPISKHPAIIAEMIDSSDNLVGIQRIYLDHEGRKAKLETPKMSFGKMGAILLGNVSEDTVHVAEGLETSLAILCATKLGLRCLMSAGGIRRFDPPEATKELVIWADNDRNGVGVKAANALALKAVRKGIKAFVLVPDHEIPEGQSSVDWLDVYSQGPNQLTEALHNKIPFTIQHNVIEKRDHEVDPIPLQRSAARQEEFPLESLGSLAPVVSSLIRATQAPGATCAQSVLAAVSMATQPHRNIEIDGRISPLSNFFITVSASGERKSTVDRKALKPFRDIENDEYIWFVQASEQFEIAKLAYEAARKRILNNKKLSRHQIQDEIRSLGSAPLPPLSNLRLPQDPTYEGLMRLFEFGQPSLGLFSDEGGRILGGHGMSENNVLKMITGLSELWDGNKPINKVRAGEGVKQFFGRRFSMHLMIQPVVARSVFDDTLMSNQGFLARALCCFPEPRAGSRSYTTFNVSECAHYSSFVDRIKILIKAPYPLAEGNRQALDPPCLKLSDQAKSMWISFYEAMEAQLGPGKPLEPIQPFAAKICEHALRLAGSFTVYDDLFNEQIQIERMKDGIEIAQFYLDEALRIYQHFQGDQDLIVAEKLLKWAQKYDQIYLQKVYQNGPTEVRNATYAKKLIKILEEHRWLSPCSNLEIDGRRRKEAWRVHRV